MATHCTLIKSLDRAAKGELIQPTGDEPAPSILVPRSLNDRLPPADRPTDIMPPATADHESPHVRRAFAAAGDSTAQKRR